ncbi:MAG: ABC transporter ATP-binding protein [Bacteroidetes bacterium]|nr:ABC transporter ATP-binding protein [Bacteroidota bacterium]MBU1677970.1 ABC transporter ATP-binding protein [Bacteroidota bacterium]
MNKILTIENISKSFSIDKINRLQILKDISFEMESKLISVIVGASGAGKSTLLHIMGGLDYPDKGKVILDNTDIFMMNDERLSKFRNENIGFVFQFHHLLPEFTALENVNIPQMIGGKSKKNILKRSEELLELVGLKDRMNHRPSELSGGEQQRVAVARAMANSPKLILADEPTGNLDSKNSSALHKLFLKLRDDFSQTLLIVTHNPELVDLADRVYEMKDGDLKLR